MISLVTVAVFIYRKPFQHLFSAVGYGTIGSTERAEYSLREAGSTFRRSTLDAATVAVPGVAGYRAARWARRNPGQAAAVAAGVAAGAGAGVAAGTAASADTAARAGTVASASSDAYASRLRPDAPPPADGEGEASTGSRRVVTGVSAAGTARNRNVPEAASGGGRVAPPLDLPPRSGGSGSAGSSGAAGAAGSASGWSRGAGRSAATGPVGPRTRAASSGSSGSSRVSARSGSAGSAPPISGGGGGGGGSGGSRGNNGGSGPAWPSSGWPAVSARQRSGSGPKPNQATSAPAEPADRGGKATGRGQDDKPSTPFWLRPIRRDK
jgi:hypothetical protein